MVKEANTEVSTQQTSHENPLADFGPNEWIVDEMYQRYLADPSSVDPAWHDFFADYKPAMATGSIVTPDEPTAANATPRAPGPPGRGDGPAGQAHRAGCREPCCRPQADTGHEARPGRLQREGPRGREGRYPPW